MLRCVKAVVGKICFGVQLKYGKKKDMGNGSLTWISSKEEFGQVGEDSIRKDELLTIDGGTFSKKVAYTKKICICMYFIFMLY